MRSDAQIRSVAFGKGFLEFLIVLFLVGHVLPKPYIVEFEVAKFAYLLAASFPVLVGGFPFQGLNPGFLDMKGVESREGHDDTLEQGYLIVA